MIRILAYLILTFSLIVCLIALRLVFALISWCRHDR